MVNKPSKIVTYLDRPLPIKWHDAFMLWTHGLVKSRDNLISFYFHYHSAYGHHTRKPGDLPWGASSHVNPPLQDLARSREKLKPPLPQYLWPQNLTGWWLASNCLLPIKSNDHMITWFRGVTWEAKNILCPLSQCLWPRKLPGWWLTLSDMYP